MSVCYPSCHQQCDQTNYCVTPFSRWTTIKIDFIRIVMSCGYCLAWLLGGICSPSPRIRGNFPFPYLLLVFKFPTWTTLYYYFLPQCNRESASLFPSGVSVPHIVTTKYSVSCRLAPSLFGSKSICLAVWHTVRISVFPAFCHINP
jgi:hypothetical protein